MKPASDAMWYFSVGERCFTYQNREANVFLFSEGIYSGFQLLDAWSVWVFFFVFLSVNICANVSIKESEKKLHNHVTKGIRVYLK